MFASRTFTWFEAWQSTRQSAWQRVRDLPWSSILIDGGLLALFVLSSTRLLRR
jgi:hypothetical protein